jgi:hypothetical protein
MNSSATTKGFVLPVAIGVGLIAILLGVMVIARSSQNRITSIASKETARSLAAAETGITQFQALFNRYRPLATYCSGRSAPAPSSCGTVTWQTVEDSNLAGSDVCEAAAKLVKDYADDFTNNQWKSVSDNPTDGQFRLVSYFYRPDPPGVIPFLPGTGELTIEGRVNQNSDNTASNRTSTTRIRIQFPVTNLPPNRTEVPGLWVSSGADSTIIGTPPELKTIVLKTNIRDSACTAAVNTTLQALQSPPPSPPYEYQSTPGNYFPLLPAEGKTPPTTGTPGFYKISSIKAGESLPRSSDAAVDNVYSYSIEADGNQSINLVGGSVFKVGQSSTTVKLYLDGGINVSSSQIQVASGSKLIIYAHGPVTLSGNSSSNPIENAGTPASENVQLYVYPSTAEPTPTVNVSGGSASVPMQFLLFAPNSQVIFNAASKVKGTIWAKSWKGDSDSVLEQASTDLSNVKMTFPRISPITVWQRLAIP